MAKDVRQAGDARRDPPAAARDLSPAAQRALAEAAERRLREGRPEAEERPAEVNGRGGAEPVRFGDWEVKGLAVDF